MASVYEQDPQMGRENEPPAESLNVPRADSNVEFRVKEAVWNFATSRGIWKGAWLAEMLYPDETAEIERSVRFGS